jgi:hypothetical protein
MTADYFGDSRDDVLLLNKKIAFLYHLRKNNQKMSDANEGLLRDNISNVMHFSGDSQSQQNESVFI